MTRLFLDCEWADLEGTELVSLALVSEDGRDRFYAERKTLPVAVDFVRNVVYPLLDRGDAAMPDAAITIALRHFLARFNAPFVLFDYLADGTLFDFALAGFDLPETVIERLEPAPSVNKTLIMRDEVRRYINLYFREYPDLALRRHHAGVDAEALRWAFQKALREGTP